MITIIEKKKLEEMENRIKELEEKEKMLNSVLEKYGRAFAPPLSNPFEVHFKLDDVLCYVDVLWKMFNKEL